MAGQADGSIIVDTDVDASGFEKGLDNLRSSMESLTAAIDRIGKKLESVVSNYAKSLAGGVRDVQRIQSGAEQAGESVKDALSEMTAKTEAVSAAADKTAQSYGKVAQEAEKAKAALSEVGGATKDSFSEYKEAYKNAWDTTEKLRSGLVSMQLLESGGTAEERFGFVRDLEDAERELLKLYDVIDQFQGTEHFKRLNAEAAEIEAKFNQVRMDFEALDATPIKPEAEFPIIKEIEELTGKLNFLYDRASTITEMSEDDGGALSDKAKEAEEYAQKLQNLRLQLTEMYNSERLISQDSAVSEGFFQQLKSGLYESEQRARELQVAFQGAAKKAPSGEWSESFSRVSAEIQKAETALARFQAKTAKMDAIGASEKAWASIEYDIGLAADEAERLQAELDEISESGGIDETQYESLSQRLQDAIEGFNALTGAADETEKETRKISPVVRGIGTAFSIPFRAVGALASNVGRLGVALAKITGAGFLSFMRTFAASAEEAAKSLAKMTATAVSSGIKRLGAWLSNAAKSMTLFGRSAKRNNGVLKKSFATILKYGLGVRSFYYLFRKIRQAIADGYQNLARYSDTLNASISDVISSFKRFENQFAASFAPLVNTIAPAISQLIDGLTEATFRAGQFIAALSGQKTVIRAKEVQEDYAASLQETKKAAKDAKNQLAGFDKLEILKEKDEHTDPNDMFETVPVEDEAKQFADDFKDAWINVDLSGIGKIVGGKIKAALDNIPWPDIQQGAKNAGKRLATFLNGLIAVPDLGKSLGKSIAEAVNAAFSFLDGFVWTFDWKGLGGAIMDTVEAACDNLNWELISHALQGLAIGLADLLNVIFSRVEVWEKVGRIIGKGINAAVSTGITFLERFDFKQAARAIVAGLNAAILEIEWDNVGRFFGDLFGGALQFLYTAVTKFNWQGLGNQIAVGVNAFTSTVRRKIYDINWADMGAAIADGINAAIIGIEWGGVGETVGMLFGGALTAAASFIRELNYGEIVQAAQDFFSNAIQQINWYDLLTVWGVAALVLALKKIIMAHPLLTILVGAVLALGAELGNAIRKIINDIPWAEVGQTLSQSMINALNRLHEAIQSVNWFELGQSVGRFLGNINWSEIVNAVFKIIGDLIIAGFKTLGDVIVGMGPTGIINALWALAKIIGAYIAGKTVLALLTGSAKGLFSSLAWNIASGISGMGPLLSGAFGSLFAKIAPSISAAAGPIMTAGGNLIEAFVTQIESFTVLGNTLLTGAASAFAISSLAIADALLLSYDVKALKEASDAFHEAQEAHNKETENALENLAKLYTEKGPEIAAEWAKTCYGIDISGMELSEAQEALTQKVDSLWDDVPQNMWDGFKAGWNEYFGENGKGLFALLGDAFTGAVEGIRKQLGINSPSTVMEEIGDNTVAGLFNGISAAWHTITDFFPGALDEMQAAIENGWSAISDGASAAWNGISTTLSGVWGNIKTNAGTALSEINKTASGKWNGLKSDASQAWNELKASVGQAISAVKQDAVSRVSETVSGIKPQWAKMKTDAVSEWNGLKSSVVSSAVSVKSQVASAFQSLPGILSGVWSSIRSAASGALSAVSATVSSMVTSISSRVSSIRSTVSNITSSASDALSRVANKMDDLTRKAASTVTIGGLASGGVVTNSGHVRSWYDSVRKYASGTAKAAGSLFVAGEAGPELVGHVNGRTEVLNESQIASAIYSAVLSAMSEAVKTLGGFLSQQMATNTNALITAITQAQGPAPVELAPDSAALLERLSALSAAPYQVPAYATGTVMPYEVVAEIRRQTSELKDAIYDNGENVIQAVVSAIANHGLALANAIGNIQTAPQQGYDPDDMTRRVIAEINRQTRMLGKSPLKS